MVEDDERGNVMAEQQEGKPVDEGEEVEALRAELESVKNELRKAKESSESSLNKVRYLMADFDNYRKQMEKQLASKAESIKAELLLKFLNIRDDYLRALSVARQSKSEQVVVIEGLEGILKNIDSLLASEGVREIEAVGTPFDPNVHDAIAYSARDDLAENTVTAEIRKGYILNGRVLRPSLVEISKIVRNSVSNTKEMDIQGGQGGR
ncbi:MAG TPA: nucleotide exchange factor GrpE [Nitrososphaeraceae archaeon]|nr:nucleotide exchange factor GrpE [Nitrososphaeraceae archaeon]